ncbi:unnamed protein product [Amoebophrya sp. A25]|nr:unnamed protein product [Amoebophrya sp. A25]|eukprot:GSA25T00005729001.1
MPAKFPSGVTISAELTSFAGNAPGAGNTSDPAKKGSSSGVVLDSWPATFWIRVSENIAFSISGVFALRYVINATFLTTATQLTQVSQAAYRLFMNTFVAVTEMEKDVANTPWAFDWGYWYAWSLVIFFQALLWSPTVPWMTPLACLLFYMKYKTDKYNLFYKQQESGGVEKLLPIVVQAMILAVACMQFFLSGWLFVKVVPLLENHGFGGAPSDADNLIESDTDADSVRARSSYSLSGHGFVPLFLSSEIVNHRAVRACLALLATSVLLILSSFYVASWLRRTMQQHLRSDTGQVEDTSDEDEDWEKEYEVHSEALSEAYLPPTMDGHPTRWSAKLLEELRIYDFLKLYET